MLTIQDERVVMKVNGLKCAFHMPAAIMPKFKKGGEETVNALPPGSPRFAFPVDEYPSSPTNWMHGCSKSSSYWLPARPGCGMWLDFNYNYQHSHHVAVVVSIQGINPITGQQTKKLRLEQYHENCPVHNTPFGQDRFCQDCNYKWDAQNYISSNNTPRGLLWIDGFRDKDGVVRQYVFTEETCKGVAAQIIGDERVFAIGIAFYLSKQPKKLPDDNDVMAKYAKITGEEECLKFGGSKLNGFPPSNTISPSVRNGQHQNKNSRLYPPTVLDPNSFCPTEDFWLPIKADVPSEIKCTVPIDLPPITLPCLDVPARLRDSNDFIDLPQDNATSLQQLADGGANLDMFYSTQIDADGNEYNLDTGEVVATAYPKLSNPVISNGNDSDIATLKRISLANNPQLLGISVGNNHPADSDQFGAISTETGFDSESTSPAEIDGDLRQLSPEEIEQKMKKLEITAGARIQQHIYPDPEQPDFWQDEPAGFIYINYVDLKTAEMILAGGRKEMAGSFMSKVF